MDVVLAMVQLVCLNLCGSPLMLARCCCEWAMDVYDALAMLSACLVMLVATKQCWLKREWLPCVVTGERQSFTGRCGAVVAGCDL